MSELTIVSGIVVFIVALALLMPILIGLAERYYAKYCNWVWDKLGV